MNTTTMPYSTTALVGLTEEQRTIQNDIREKEGRNYLMQFITLKPGDSVVFSQGRWTTWDAILTQADGSVFVIEIKCRRVKSTQYPTFILEQSKYQSGMAKAKEVGGQFLYVNFFEDSKALIWNVSRLVLNEDYYLDKTITYNEGQARATDKTRMYLYAKVAKSKDYIKD